MNKKFYIGIDIGATNTKFGLVDGKGRIKSKKVIRTSCYNGAAQFVSIAKDIVYLFIKEKKLKKNQLCGIGIGAPGAIDSNKGIVHYLTNLKGWKGIHLRKMIESKLGIRAYLDNDANVMAIGEFSFGAGRGSKNMIGVTLGSGVGGGLVLDGRVYRGTNMAGGEIGHVPVNVEGPKCACGGSGCLEAYVGSPYIVKKTLKLIKGKKTAIMKLIKGKTSRLTPKIIYKAALKGDPIAKRILRETGIYLGVGLTGIINLLNPDAVVIGGGVANAGRFIFDAVKETVKKRAMHLPAKTVKILKAELGEDAGVVGAMALVKERQGK
ncbi:MAG: ROK family protein [Candidatus Omnitrophica bacterium]|nr:ROK family protein [Candidatus Omnitrophota bacterium]